MDAKSAKGTKGQRDKRLTAAALNQALADKQCAHCATVGAWTIYDVDGPTRYVKCKGCGHCDKLPVIVEDQQPQGQENHRDATDQTSERQTSP